MVAHGTIAFDTLTTSDQVETGTEKSLDTSYIYHGTPKVFACWESAATFIKNDTLNVTSVSDNGAGSGTLNFTNSLATNTYCSTTGTSHWHDLIASGSVATGSFRLTTYDSDHSTQVDCDDTNAIICGELA